MQERTFQNKRQILKSTSQTVSKEVDYLFYENLFRILFFTLSFLILFFILKVNNQTFLNLKKVYINAMEKDYSVSEIQETMKNVCTPILQKSKNLTSNFFEKKDSSIYMGGQSPLSAIKNCTFAPIYITGKPCFPLKQYTITSGFGFRKHPITKENGFHKGIDLASAMHAPIYAIFNGTIKETGYSKWKGNYIVLDHGNELVTIYCHCNTILQEKGNKIKRGAKIATVGSTGDSTGPHLHLELKYKNQYYNPLWLFNDSI